MLMILSLFFFCCVSGNFAGEKTKWEETTNGLKKQFQETSPVCAHLKKEGFEKEPSLK